ncbi:hypothetical protein CJU90_0187 [Yarrowia sp. C11]|nr:hypothetical protein CKK34_1599 [Yarrowia sp. E02]KAG5372541.1 hypothetical protein CJU90_0187 [Yarrowia sp. C11]
MDIRLFPEQQSDKKPNTVCHVLPCHIHYTGPANVAEYFTIEGVDKADQQVEVTKDEKADENPEVAKTAEENEAAKEQGLEDEKEFGLNDGAKTETKGESKGDSSTPLSTHFRGRKLHGVEQKLPDNYRGYRFTEGTNFFENSNTVSQLADITQDFDEDGFERNADDYRNNEPIEMRSWNAEGSFDHLVIWGHERVPDLESDQWACGVRDWHQVASAMNPIKQ